MDHSEEFIILMIQTAQTVWGLNIDGWQAVPQGRSKNRAYAVDRFLRIRLVPQLSSGLYVPIRPGLEFPKPPV
jgi:hypothetical protein